MTAPPRARPATPPVRDGRHGAIRILPVVTVLVVAGTAAALAAVAGTADAPVPGITPVAPVVALGLPVVRVLSDLAAVVAVGLSLLPALLGPAAVDDDGRETVRAARAGAMAAAAVWAVSALATVCLQTAELDPDASTDLGAVAAYVAGFGPGQALVASACAALGVALLAGHELVSRRVLPAELQSGLAVIGLLPPPMAGHASSSSQAHSVMLLSVEVHVVAATLWVGGLAAVVAYAVPRRRLLAVALPRFSRLAALCLLGATVSGVVNAGLELGPDAWSQPVTLLTSDYGVLVLAKVSVTAAIAAIGALMRRRLVRRVLDGRPGRFVAWATAELALMGLAFGLAAVLGRSSLGG